ncbi:hypothetical protein RFI_20479 [Reticulomyxa filosa]|uniref:Uncharacterized protein n=1 Tax=Reticulomyxa filosa TaxID=46433 RepID=X6MUV3_RETFI|nr:hypothetical protein RFI_20479 [Reticulomyxa filosa]|eukprot:ETO16860.1 hypothetical protein RFI_20479 [Reticulomyxa filosa]
MKIFKKFDHRYRLLLLFVSQLRTFFNYTEEKKGVTPKINKIFAMERFCFQMQQKRKKKKCGTEKKKERKFPKKKTNKNQSTSDVKKIHISKHVFVGLIQSEQKEELTERGHIEVKFFRSRIRDESAK